MTAAFESNQPVGVAARNMTSLFHRLSQVLPEDQELFCLDPEMKAFEAIERLRCSNYSQAPVTVAGTVMGVFSFRSFAMELASGDSEKVKPASLRVEECMETLGDDQFRSVTGECWHLFDLLDDQGAVLIGEPDRIQGIVTSVDMLRYLYGIASPFVHLAEIELGVRALIQVSVDNAALAFCSQTSLKDAYKGTAIPTKLEDMVFNDYVSIIGDGRNWPRFEGAFGGERRRTRAKLDEIRELRNVVFHFKRALGANDQRDLRTYREWVLLRCRVVDAREGKETPHV